MFLAKITNIKIEINEWIEHIGNSGQLNLWEISQNNEALRKTHQIKSLLRIIIKQALKIILGFRSFVCKTEWRYLSQNIKSIGMDEN